MNLPTASVHIIGSKQFGGAERFFVRLVEALHGRGHEVIAVHRTVSRVGKVLDPDIPRVELPMFNNIWDRYSPYRIRSLVKHRRPDIVQTYMGRATCMTHLPAKSKSIQVARLGGFYKIKGYYEHAHAWVANSRELRDYLMEQGLPADRIYRIGNFVDIFPPVTETELDALRRSYRIPADAILIFSLGRLIGIKGFDDLLNAFSRLPAEVGGRPLWLMIVGDGPLRAALARRAEQLQIDDRVCWPGWQDDPQPFYDLAAVFVCPSTRETLGNVILEAWAHRLPVVSTATSGARELVREGENGLLTPCADPGALAGRLLTLIREGESGWSKLAENGLKTLSENHSQQSVVSAYLEMYRELMRKYQ